MLPDSQKSEAPNPANKNSTRILLVDDHPLVREGIKAALEQQAGFVVVGEVGDGTEVIDAVKNLQPDVVVLDHVLPGVYGMEVAETLGQQQPSTRIIMMSMHEEEAYVGRALTVGVRGYVAKRAASTELVKAIDAVLQGKIYLSEPHSTDSIGRYMESAKSAKFDVYKTLTDREREVGDLIVDGYSS